jgi:hypothetical protein
MAMSSCGSNVQAKCNGGQCVLACTPIECDLTCANGFLVDSSGCLTCECAPPSANACSPAMTGPDACIEVPADCCGCARGGKDIAILSSQAAAFQASLNCPAQPQCPETNACNANLQATCSDTRCELLDPSSQPANECGVAPPGCVLDPIDGTLGGFGQVDCAAANCPAGEVCFINTIDVANTRHVGTCVAPGP